MRRGGLFVAWAASLGLVTWRAVSKNQRPPFPSEVAATVVVFGVLAVLPDDFGPAPGLFGWGLVIAALLNFYDPTNPLNKATTNKQGQTQLAQATASAGKNIGQTGQVIQ